MRNGGNLFTEQIYVNCDSFFRPVFPHTMDKKDITRLNNNKGELKVAGLVISTRGWRRRRSRRRVESSEGEKERGAQKLTAHSVAAPRLVGFRHTSHVAPDYYCLSKLHLLEPRCSLRFHRNSHFHNAALCLSNTSRVFSRLWIPIPSLIKKKHFKLHFFIKGIRFLNNLKLFISLQPILFPFLTQIFSQMLVLYTTCGKCYVNSIFSHF